MIDQQVSFIWTTTVNDLPLLIEDANSVIRRIYGLKIVVLESILITDNLQGFDLTSHPIKNLSAKAKQSTGAGLVVEAWADDIASSVEMSMTSTVLTAS